MTAARWLGLVATLWLGVVLPADAHEFRPAVAALYEQPDGSWIVQTQPAFDAARRPLPDVVPAFAPGCTRDGPVLRCREGEPAWIGYEGLSAHPVDVVVRVVAADGSQRTQVLRDEGDTMPLAGAEGTGAMLGRFVALGIEHIAIGADHVMFVLGLWLLVGFSARLFWTITGFTLAHSITLGASTLGWVEVSQGPVEAVIAVSIVLLAVEIVREAPSLTRRAPAAVAFGFGLLHGFGFAGALRQIGLPPDRAWTALLGFNLGVEIGQVLLLLGAAAIARLVGDRLGPRPRTIAVTVGGAVAVAWTIERVVALW